MADENYFLSKYGDPQDESTPEGKSNAAAVQQADDSQNYFLSTYGPAADSDNFKPVAIDNTPSIADKAGRLALEAGKGIAKPVYAAATAGGTALGAIPVLYDKLKSLLTGVDDTYQQDFWFKNFVDPGVHLQEKMNPDPLTGFAGKATNAAGSTLETIAQMVVTGPTGSEMTAAQMAEQGIAKTVARQSLHGVKSASVPAIASSVERGREVYQQTGDAKQAVAAAQAEYLQNAIGAIAPMSVAGGLAKRTASGAVSGAVTGELGRQMQNAAVSDKLQQPFAAEDMSLNAMAGAALGGIAGPRGEAGQPAATESTGPIDAVHDVRNQVQDSQVLPTVQARARAEAAARGGDKLDQEVAAAMATLQHTETARHLMLKDSQDKAFSDAEAADAAARQDIQTKAATEYEQQQIDSQKKQSETDAAFRDISNKRLQENHDTELEAYTQREMQRGAEIEQQIPYAPEPATTKLGEVAPPEVRKLAEPPAKPATETATPSEEAPAAKPVGPLDLRLRKPSEDGEPWEITVHDQILSAYPDEKTARKTLATMRQALVAHASRAEAIKTSTPEEPVPVTLPPEAGPLLPETDMEPVTTAAQVTEASKESAFHPENERPTPTDAQYRAQNYAMGHTEVQGLPVTIEHPAGSERPLGGPLKGTTRTMPDHYGYFKGTEGADGQHVDVVIGKKPDAPSAFVIDHLTADGQFEQHKVMMGFPNELAARRSYRKIYPDRPQGPVKEMSIPELKEWLHNGDTKNALQPDKIKPLRVDRAEKEAARGLRFAENNASGESPASLEAVNRVAQEKDAGRLRYQIDPDGNVSPLHGVDAVDAKAPAGHIIVQKGVGAEPYTVLDRGGLPALHVKGLLNRAREALDSATREAQPQNPKGWEKTDTGDAAPKLTKEAVEKHLQPLLDKVGRSGVQVHDSPHSDTFPADLRRRVLRTAEDRNYRLDNIRGLYDRATDTVHIFAGSHTDPQMAMRTAVHEIVAHKGLGKLLGAEREAVMRDIYDNGSRAWIDDFMRQHGLDDADPEHQRVAGEEYAAHLSERMDEHSAGVLRKAIDAVRKVLRKLGVVKRWTDADIRSLLRESETGLAKMSEHGKESQDHSEDIKFAVDPDRDPRVLNDPTHPLSQLAKHGATVEAQRNNSRSFVRSRLEALKDFGQNHIETALKAIPRRNLPDFMSPKKMPSMREYVRTANRMDGRRNELLTKSEAIGKNWNRYVTKNKPGGRLLGELMHASTLAGVDPSRDYAPKYTSKKSRPISDAERTLEIARRQQYAALKSYWNKLDPDGRQIFHEVRDHYQDRRRAVEEGLMNRIRNSEASGQTKSALMDHLRQQFEAGRVQEPYFPLARFGDYWAVAKDEDGQTASFSRFESPAEQKQWKAEMAKHGFDVDGGKKMEAKSMMQRIDPAFVAKITEHVGEVDPKLADDIWQQFLQSMPEMSMRKAFIHRQGRLGFTADALRAFGNSTFHSAHQIAKLEHLHELEGHLHNMELQARELEMQNDPESHWSAPLVKEMKDRHDWAMRPQASSIAAKLVALGHFWYLGTSPAHAFIFATQNPMVAYPTLSAKHGWNAAGRELTRAMGQYAGSRGPLGNRLRGDERAAFDEAQRIGLFSRTNAYTLLGVRDAGEGYNPNGVWTRAKEVSGWLLHKTDEMNRQTTFLAGYRLARSEGMPHNEAIEHAEDMTWDSHFDYSNANRPQLLRSNAAKVIFLFRQYMVNLVYRITRDFSNGLIPSDSSSANTPELRSEARQRLAGVLGQLGLMAGATGMPMYWAVTGIMNAVMGDKDKPFDSDIAMRAHLAQQLGPTASKAIMDGPFDALTGATLSSRVELNNLWLKDTYPELDGNDKFLHLLGEAAGPVASIAMGGFQGAKLIAEGQYERAIESAAPKVVRDQMKAVRFAREGAVDLKGNTVMDKDEFTKKDIVMQSLGFTPSSLQTRYEQNTALKTAQEEIKARRALLMNRLFLAAHNDDAQGTQEALADIEHFNGRNPGVPIRGDNIIGAAKARAKMNAETVNGVRLERGLSGLRSELNFESSNPPEEEPAQ